MTVTVFILSLLAAMAIGMPIAYALLVCGVTLMAFLAATSGLWLVLPLVVGMWTLVRSEVK